MEYNERYRLCQIRYKLDDVIQPVLATTSDLSCTIIYLERIIDYIYNDYTGDSIPYKVNGARHMAGLMPAGVNIHRRLIIRYYSKGRYVKVKRDIENNSRYIGDR